MMKSSQIEFFAIIWGAMVVLSGMSMMFVRESAVVITIVLGVVALLSTIAIAATVSSTNGSNASENAEKTKNSASNSDALLRLLDEDDLAELRSRLKRRLIDQIEGGSGSDGELSSLDALLAEQNTRRR